MLSDLDRLRERLRRFTEAREWRQFHTPKNLALALAGEVGELAAVLQWLDEDQVVELLSQPETKQLLVEEIADVLIYLVRLADVCHIDLAQAAEDKISLNEQRYPEDLVRGSALKYSHRQASVTDSDGADA